jgi:hypothetical protein
MSEPIMPYSLSPEERSRLDDLMTNYNIVFSGYQVLITLQPFSFIRRVYGDIKLCIVKFWSTSILCDELNREYNSILLRPLVNPDPARIRTFIPKTEFIDGMQPAWSARVAAYAISDNKKTLIIMEGTIWPEDCKIHYKRINIILDALNELSAQKSD